MRPSETDAHHRAPFLGWRDVAAARGPFTIVTEVEGKDVTMSGKSQHGFSRVDDEWRLGVVYWNPDQEGP